MRSWGRSMRGATIRLRRRQGGPATIHTPEPINRAFGPDGFLRRFDLRPELSRITAPTLITRGAA